MAFFDFLKKDEFEEIRKLRLEILQKNERIAQLSKWEGIVDAEFKANEILRLANEESLSIVQTAKAKADQLLNEADELLASAQNESEIIRKEAKIAASEMKSKAESILNQATANEARILREAKVRAEEIAGEAYNLKQQADDLERTITALKNAVKGYGDEYIIPSYSLLDQLAEDYGFTEAGEDLKNARDKSKLMVKNRTAASCDYVEDYRRTTAINFIVDAFNGKVDSLLSTIKHDNFGTLKQKITDSYYLVNNLGKAFRNAVIADSYLDARVNELKYSTILMELKRKEQEEQREIREQLREEEKARREIEKALRDAAKEEEMLTKAMNKLKAQMEQASEDQKAKYESQIAELELKWKEAEERNQRALSMAQQTRSGHVYVISNIGSFGENVYKIGMTRRLEPLDRVRELGDASVPFPFDVHAMIWSENAPTLETDLHKFFLRNQLNKVNPRKEFFKLTLKEIREKIQGMDVQTKWTMLAEAMQYRESLAIEKSLESNVNSQEEWEQSQTNQMEIIEELEAVED
jgi:GrpB-like predicted nucleotidyltransferase (UPF0157 family)